MAQDTLIIGLSDFAEYHDIGSNIDSTERLLIYCRQAQRIDFKNIVGEALYYDIIANGVNASPVPTKYSKLIDGTTYSNSQSNTVYFEGIKPVIIYFAYARYLTNDNVISTRSGFKYKLADQSEAVPRDVLKSLAKEAQSTAIYYQNELRKYLDENLSDFPLWSQGYDVRPRKTTMRITSVRKDDNYPAGNKVNNATTFLNDLD